MANWINSIPKDKWTLAHDSGYRFGHLTTNMAECINGVLKGARNLPITALVQMTYFKLVEYFVKRKTDAHRKLFVENQLFTDDFNNSWAVNMETASSHHVRRFNLHGTKFLVEEPFNPVTQTCGAKYTLNLEEGWCDCGLFQALHYPCSHVLAACASMSVDPKQYVHRVYTMQSLYSAYQAEWEPIKDESYWPPAPAFILVPNPALRRGHGRPKSSRLHNEMDWMEKGHQQYCSRCHQSGHNRRRCTQAASSSVTGGEGCSS